LAAAVSLLTEPVATPAESAAWEGTALDGAVSTTEGVEAAGTAAVSAASLVFSALFGEQASAVKLRTHAQKKPIPARRLVSDE
ncbi:MAG TPA: hypothetical protein VIQ74_15965, partial [Gemmatimonadaceae bacterium]